MKMTAMDNAKQHWPILQKLGTDLVNSVRSFMVVGQDGEGLIVATQNGLALWFGTLRFKSGESITANIPTLLDISELFEMAHWGSNILLLNKQGIIYSMEENDLGQLELKTINRETRISTQFSSITDKFISVRCGDGHSLALTENGKIWAWGSNTLGQVGLDSSIVSISSPRQIDELNSCKFVSVECGGFHSLALTNYGDVYCWGSNKWGQLNNGSDLLQQLPNLILPKSPVKSIAAGLHHTLLLTETGEVFACGRNRRCQLGFPNTTKFSRHLSKVEGLPPISKIASHPATNLSIALSHDQRCFVWGQLRPKMYFFNPLMLTPVYSTVESPLTFYSNIPYSISVSESLLNRLSTRMSQMFDNPETSDVQFVVEQRTIHAHRNILINSSEYFGIMFSERWQTLVDPKKVTIPNLYSYQAFHAFLRFIYTDCFEVYSNLLPELFELAIHYFVPDLQQFCLLRMRTTLSSATCCLYYQLTHRHSLPELDTLQQEIVQFASAQMSEIVCSEAYQLMEPDLCNNLNNAVQNFLD